MAGARAVFGGVRGHAAWRVLSSGARLGAFGPRPVRPSGPPSTNRPHNLRNPPDPRSATNRPASVFSDISLSWTKIADM